MRERLEQLGGRCDVVTAPGKGTRVTFEVPVRIPEGVQA
jgi:signal transduction histidine kinase